MNNEFIIGELNGQTEVEKSVVGLQIAVNRQTLKMSLEEVSEMLNLVYSPYDIADMEVANYYGDLASYYFVLNFLLNYKANNF